MRARAGGGSKVDDSGGEAIVPPAPGGAANRKSLPRPEPEVAFPRSRNGRLRAHRVGAYDAASCGRQPDKQIADALDGAVRGVRATRTSTD